MVLGIVIAVVFALLGLYRVWLLNNPKASTAMEDEDLEDADRFQSDSSDLENRLNFRQFRRGNA